MKNAVARCAAVLALALLAAQAGAATRNIWISQAELQSKPMSGLAWRTVDSIAHANWGSQTLGNIQPSLNNQDSKHAAKCVAGAIYYARKANDPLSDAATIRDKVRDAILEAKRTMDEDAEYNQAVDTVLMLDATRTLGVGRQLAGYVIAADLIDLAGLDPLSDSTIFKPWLSAITTQEFANSNSRFGKTIVRTHESTNQWGLEIAASRTAIAAYLGNNALLARCDSFFKAHTNQSYFPSGSVWFFPDTTVAWQGGDYFSKRPYQSTWVCTDTTSWLTISPNCLKTDAQGDTLTIDGAIVTQLSRIGSGGPASAFAFPLDSEGINYQWTALQQLFVQAEILYRAGYNAYAWGSNALKRCMDVMVRAGWTGSFDNPQARMVPWMANHRYGTAYPTSEELKHPSWQMGWTDFTHAGTIQIETSPSVLAFNLNVSSNKTFTIRNVGAGTLDVTSITVPAGKYSVSPSSATLLFNGTQAVTVSYNAGGSGSSSQLVTIASNAPGASSVTVSCTASGAEGEEP